MWLAYWWQRSDLVVFASPLWPLRWVRLVAGSCRCAATCVRSAIGLLPRVLRLLAVLPILGLPLIVVLGPAAGANSWLRVRAGAAAGDVLGAF